jgi:hypothetical protein
LPELLSLVPTAFLEGRFMPRPFRFPRWAAVAAAALCLLAAAACSRPTLELEETQSFRDATRTQSMEGFVPEGTEELSLSLDLRVERGTAAYRLRDPQGVVRWEGELTSGGRMTDRRELEPVVGNWRLDLQMVGATGEYEARWLGR